ncbi:hypothetical protein [Pelotomaculum propionicicum]|uniref:Uncharacterized protein n=1 Tax=Pelotomaculum propionicicum TaxID=258475 RepID=A0A4Y7RKC8_9FIRM|nr:hypothetical protein [Pelotomaculum propionicicum]TEB09303.1 hypothetical protein Pmgp_03235 [Pelotomaculum propionicicum]
MPDPIQGFDVSVMVIGQNGPEMAGEYQELEFSIKNDTEEYLELGERIARILDGEVKIEGKLKRGWTSLDIVNQVFGASTLRRGERVPQSPRFVITCSVDAPEKGLQGRYKFEQAVIPELSISVSQGKGVAKKDLSFKAEGFAAA